MAKKEAKASKKENSKNKKSFWKDFKAELKKVVWPTPKQSVNNTVAVVTIVLITAAIVFILDLTFEALNKHGVDKIKEVVVTSNTVSDNTTTEETDIEEEVTDETTEDVTEEVTENTETSNEQTSTENEENVESDTENNVQ